MANVEGAHTFAYICFNCPKDPEQSPFNLPKLRGVNQVPFPQKKISLGPGQRILTELYCFWLVRPSVCPSVRLSVVTLTQSFLIGFLPNFIYGLLPSISRSSLNTGFVRHPIINMTDKMAVTYMYQYLLKWSL